MLNEKEKKLSQKQEIDLYNYNLIKSVKDKLINTIDNIFKNCLLYDITISSIIVGFCICPKILEIEFTEKNIKNYELQKNYILKDCTGKYLINCIISRKFHFSRELIYKHDLLLKDIYNNTGIYWLWYNNDKDLKSIIVKLKFTFSRVFRDVFLKDVPLLHLFKFFAKFVY